MNVNAQKKIDSAFPEAGVASSEAAAFPPLAQLEERYEKMRERLGKDASEDPDCELARLKVELSKAECDLAGAVKFKGFVRRNRELFVPAEEGEGYRVAEGNDNRRYLLVNMGELDRLNKEGHNQAAGDTGLEAVVTAARRTAEKRGQDISVYRYGGNEYMIEFPDASEIDVTIFEQAFRKEGIDLGDFRHLEAPPLSITRVDFSEVIEIMDSIALSAPEGEVKDAREAAAESVTVLTRFADYNLEREKFVTRVGRAIEKIEAAKAGRISREEASAFFDTYLKKDFFGSGLDSLADIDDLWRGGDDREDFERAAGLMAVEAAKRKFADDRWFEVYERHLASGLMREYLRTVKTRDDEAESAPEFFDENMKLAKIPDPRYGTAGLRVLSHLHEAIGRRGEKWRRAEETAYEAEAMKRDAATGLPERGQFYEEADERIVKNEPTSLIFIDLGYLKYFNNAGRRAVGDAALLKAAEVMEEALMESEVNAEIYRYGGDEFVIMVEGDAAEAESLKQDIERVRSGAGRIPDLRSLREQGRATESIGDSRPDYAPMELVLNYGISDLGSVNMLMNDLGEERVGEMLAKSRRSRSALVADLLVKTADAAVGYQKAESRFHELLELMDQPGYRDEDSPTHKRVESVIAASRKAIFAGMGGEDLLRLWADEKPEHLDKLIDRFVSDRLEKMDAILESRKELSDKLVEIHAARNRLLDELGRLQVELKDRDVLLKKDKDKIASLEARLMEAEKARKSIIEQRQKIAESSH